MKIPGSWDGGRRAPPGGSPSRDHVDQEDHRGCISASTDRRPALDVPRRREARRRRARRAVVRSAGARLPGRVQRLPRARPHRGRAGGGLRRAGGVGRLRGRRRARAGGSRQPPLGRARVAARPRRRSRRRSHPRARLRPRRRLRAAGGLPRLGSGMSEGRVVTSSEPLWFLGTLVRPLLTGDDTGGRFAVWEGVLPRGAAPPLHTHPQDETFYVLEGELTIWLVERGPTDGREWVGTRSRRCG